MTKETRRGVSRRGVLKVGGAAAALTAAAGIGLRFGKPNGAYAADYAAGMTGGPTGFPGAERYQYNADLSEGRAIEGIKKLKAEGKAPDKLQVLMTDGAIGHYTRPYPANAPTIKEVWERETGIELVFTGVSPEEQFKKVLQDVTTQSGAFDVYTCAYNNTGDLAEANGLEPLDDFVAKYQPDFNDPARGSPTPEIYDLLYKYAGKVMTVSLDGDFQTWVYRKDLFEDPQNIKEFGDKHGWQLGHPRTWQELDQIAAFFTGKGFYGNGNMMSPFWGISNWYNRYVSKAAPNFYLFDDNGKPLIDSEVGIKATEEHIKSLDWTTKDGLAWSWSEYYGSMASGKSVMMSTFTNLPKFNDRLDDQGKPTSAIVGKLNSFLPPGHQFGNDLVRRSTLYLGNNGSVSSQSKFKEAAYLFLQWTGSTRVFSWLTANPGGFFDPFQLANFEDPLVLETYKPYHVPVISETIKRSVPTLAVPGAFGLHNILDENISAAMTGSMSVKEAMEKAAKEWQKFIKKKGEDRMLEAINKAKSGWPSLIDKA